MGKPTRFDVVEANDFIGMVPNQIGGITYYVNNATSALQEDAIAGSDANDGRSPIEPFATIQRAVDKCVSNRGDKIVIFPGTYDENVVILNKNYITIVGALSAGYARPDVTPTTGIALFANNSHGLVLLHTRFVSADSDSVVNEGNGYLFYDCVFDGSAGQAITEANLRLVGDAADDSYTASEGKIINCLFRDSGGVGIAFQHAALTSGVGITDVEIHGCRFYGNTGVDIATQANVSGGGAGILSRFLLAPDNMFMTTDKTVYLDLDNASAAGGDELLNNGIISGHFADDAALNATKIDISGTNFRWVGGFNGVGVVDGSAFDN